MLRESQAPETGGKVWSDEDLPLVGDQFGEHVNKMDVHKSMVPDAMHSRELK